MEEMTTQEAVNVVERLLRERKALEHAYSLASSVLAADQLIAERREVLSGLDQSLKDLQAQFDKSLSELKQKEQDEKLSVDRAKVEAEESRKAIDLERQELLTAHQVFVSGLQSERDAAVKSWGEEKAALELAKQDLAGQVGAVQAKLDGLKSELSSLVGRLS